jgi:hypothetical protein
VDVVVGREGQGGCGREGNVSAVRKHADVLVLRSVMMLRAVTGMSVLGYGRDGRGAEAATESEVEAKKV